MSRLARFRGHFYNWYDTRDLRPLDPQYVSSVDSGNLAGHLIALANACREWTDQALTDARRLAGIADALELAREEAEPTARRAANADRDVAPARRGVRGAGGRICDGRSLTATGSRSVSPTLAVGAEILADIARALASERGDGTGADMLFWAEAARSAIESHRRDLDRFGGDGRVFGGAPRGAGGGRASDGARDGVRLPARPRPQAALDRLSRRRGHARPELLRSARLRGAAGELHGDRQGRRSGPPLVPPRPCRHAGRARRGADLLVGIDVRISDAVAGHARAGGKPDRSRPAG